MNRLKKSYGCPVELSLELLAGKWKPVILARLKDGPLRYGELRRLVPDLSDKVLTERLHGLEEQGFASREPVPDEPGRFRYRLTERGETLRPVLQALYDWGDAAARDLGVTVRAERPA